jgi:cysteinyl-tRNA synthetase
LINAWQKFKEIKMSLQIYNSMSQKREEFISLSPKQVKMYVCGPTVYNLLHIGNFRGPIFFNLVRNWLEHSGYDVNFVYNYTDVDDKIIEKSIAEKIPASEISEKYIKEFQKDFAALSLKPHDKNPKVTEHMKSIIALIASLVENGSAYVIEGEVLFSVRKFHEYGKLSHRNIDDLKQGVRVEKSEKKQDPLDFALWKPAKPGEPKWPSPWGEGRPGWHIECSAMVKVLLGDSIDIHGGGMDLIFPHHENEIAQSEAESKKPFVKYWMHNNMINFGDKKMSKSLGNIKTTREFLKEYNAEILKYMMLSIHYRSVSDFSEKAIENAVSGLARIYSALALANHLHTSASDVPGKVVPEFQKVMSTETEQISKALDDDFNTPEVMAALFRAVRSFNTLFRYGMKMTSDVRATCLSFETWLRDKGQLLALFQEDAAQYLGILDDMLLTKKNLQRTEIDQLVTDRAAARTAKDFKKGDEIRAKLTELGIKVFDLGDVSKWEVEK